MNLTMSTVTLIKVKEVKLSNLLKLSTPIPKVNGWEYIFERPG